MSLGGMKIRKPVLRFNALVISITTVIMFGIWTLLDLLSISNNVFKITTVLISFITSLGFYQTLVGLFAMLFDLFDPFRKWVLGPYNLEGYWVGFSSGSQGNVRYYYEKYEQEIDEIYVSGQSFTENGGFHGSWNIMNPSIDINSGEMTYCFEADSLGNTFANPGFGKFNFIRSNKKTPPSVLRGYTSYVYNTNKLLGVEVKLPKGVYTDQELFDEAKKVFEEYSYTLEE